VTNTIPLTTDSAKVDGIGTPSSNLDRADPGRRDQAHHLEPLRSSELFKLTLEPRERVKGPAQSIPDNLTVDVAELGIHEHITAGQVALPKGFTLITPAETVVVSVEVTRAEVSEGVTETVAEAPPAEAPAE
jgi:hypothetical protein